jgi:hypothetical protein
LIYVLARSYEQVPLSPTAPFTSSTICSRVRGIIGYDKLFDGLAHSRERLGAIHSAFAVELLIAHFGADLATCGGSIKREFGVGSFKHIIILL